VVPAGETPGTRGGGPAPAAPAPAAPGRPARPVGPGAPGAAGKPTAAPSSSLAALNDRLRSLLPHGDASTMGHFTPGFGPPDLDLVRRYVPVDVLAATFGLITVTRTTFRADSITYVFERRKDIFGRETCRALRFTPHPLPPAPPRFDPNHPPLFGPDAPNIKPDVEYVNVSCDARGIEAVEPGSLLKPPAPTARP
jgi:hypothetical protein